MNDKPTEDVLICRSGFHLMPPTRRKMMPAVGPPTSFHEDILQRRRKYGRTETDASRVIITAVI